MEQLMEEMQTERRKTSSGTRSNKTETMCQYWKETTHHTETDFQSFEEREGSEFSMLPGTHHISWWGTGVPRL